MGKGAMGKGAQQHALVDANGRPKRMPARIAEAISSHL